MEHKHNKKDKTGMNAIQLHFLIHPVVLKITLNSVSDHCFCHAFHVEMYENEKPIPNVVIIYFLILGLRSENQ